MAKAIRVVKDGPNVSVRLVDGSTRHVAPGETVIVDDEQAARYLGMTPAIFEDPGAQPEQEPEAPRAKGARRKAKG